MRKYPPCGLLTLGVVFTAVLSTLVVLPSCAQAEELPSQLSDQMFWRIVTEFSEQGGVFQAEVMSNEDSAQFVIPSLQRFHWTRRAPSSAQ